MLKKAHTLCVMSCPFTLPLCENNGKALNLTEKTSTAALARVLFVCPARRHKQ